jgi:hypothetical protein
MPLKQTKPRAGSKPMVYFKGTRRGFSRLKLRRRFGGLRLTAPTKLKKQVLEAMQQDSPAQVIVAKIEKKRNATHIAVRVARKGHTYIVSPAPARHGVTRGGFWKGYLPSFLELKKILEEGFKPNHPVLRENVQVVPEAGPSPFARQNFPSAALKKEERKVTNGDSFTLKMNTALASPRWAYASYWGSASAPNNQLLGIIIKLQRNLKARTRKAKINFYRREIQQKYGIPVKFVW